MSSYIILNSFSNSDDESKKINDLEEETAEEKKLRLAREYLREIAKEGRIFHVYITYTFFHQSYIDSLPNIKIMLLCE